MTHAAAAAADLVEGVLAPIDRVRRAAFAAAGPRVAAWLVDRERRVALYGVVVVLGALALTGLAPLWSLAFGPLVLGVPHLLADVRYLWVRPGFHRRASVWIAVGAPLVLGALTGRTAWGFAACLGAVAIARAASPWRRAGIAALAALLLVVAVTHRHAVDLAFAHAHNLVALALWWAWRPRTRRVHAIPLALFAVAAVAIALGALAPLAAFAATGPGSWSAHVATLAPFATPAVGVRLVLLFAFAQSVHYGVWLRLVPEEDRPREAPRPFASSFRALRDDLGPVLLVVAAVLGVALAAWAAFDVVAARAGYLRFANFHGQLELAAAALFALEGRPGRAAPADPLRDRHRNRSLLCADSA
jgi:hypothetical protein